MEIIHIILGKANPDRMNGVNKVVYQLATKQIEFGKKVAVWGIANDTENNYGDRNFETKLFLKQKNPFTISKELKKAMIAKKDKAIFHIHGGWIPVFYSLAKLLDKHQINFVITPHGAYNTIAMERSFWLKKIYFSLFEKKILERTSKIHCIGKSEVEGLCKIYTTSKICLLPYGYEAYSVQKNKEYEKGQEFVIGFVGRVDVYTKGLDLLLEAFNIFSKIHWNSKLWIIGDGNDKKKFEVSIKTKKLEGKVVLFGGVFGIEKELLIKQMAVFAHPSRNEGLPSSVLEASGMGIPCLVSKATNVAEQIQNYNSGLVLPNNDIISIHSALESLYNLWLKDELKVVSKNACNMVANEFNWTKILKDFETLYT